MGRLSAVAAPNAAPRTPGKRIMPRTPLSAKQSRQSLHLDAEFSSPAPVVFFGTKRSPPHARDDLTRRALRISEMGAYFVWWCLVFF